MSFEWRRIKLRDVGRIVTGKTPSTSRADFFGGLVPFLTPTDMPDGLKYVGTERTLTEAGLATVKNCLIPKGVAVSCIGWKMGKSVLITSPTVTNQQINTVVVDESRFDLSFVYYLLSSIRAQIFELGATPTRTPIVNKSTFGNIDILVPGLPLQREIAHLGTALDDRITLLRETNATLEAIAQALFKSWFVDFDPVRAKMEGRTPEGMDEATAALFPDSFEESELGLVPRGWRYSTVGLSFVLTMGQSPPGDTYSDDGNGLPFYQGRTDFGFRFPTKRMYCSAPTRIAEIGDTLVSVRAPVGDVNMAIERCCVGRGVASVRHPKDYRSFTFYSMRGLGSHFENFDSEGTIFGSISKKDFQALPVISPTLPALAAYDAVSSPIDAKVVENEEQIRILANIRDTLLPRLISGQLRLPDAGLAGQ